ncbi:MAG: hypothetical protein KF791_03155 [Verrucomicrobiae bacterium]|nr:hypothetical protein [Verrucomicrobiae bacterium]
MSNRPGWFRSTPGVFEFVFVILGVLLSTSGMASAAAAEFWPPSNRRDPVGFQGAAGPAGELINVNFGVNDTPNRTGPAAFGLSTEDHWNLYSRDDGSGGYLERGVIAGLKNSLGMVTDAGLVVSNAPGAWGNGVEDPMYGVFLHPLGTDRVVSVTVTNLPPGTYQIYCFGHGDTDSLNTEFEIFAGSQSLGSLRTTTGAAWRSTEWNHGDQYVHFENVVLGPREPLVILAHPGSGQFGVINGIQIHRVDDNFQRRLININFGIDDTPTRAGPAAFGIAGDDFWNLYSRDDGLGGYLSSGRLEDLRDASGARSGASVEVENAPGAWGNGSADPMFGVFLYPLGADPVVRVTLNALPPGVYSVYCYGHGEQDAQNVEFEVIAGPRSAGVSRTTESDSWRMTEWKEGDQYVVFREVRVHWGDSLMILGRPAAASSGLINGLQLYRAGDLPPDRLVNVNFGVKDTPQRRGPAAVGESPLDYWNLYSRDGEPGEYRHRGEIANLRYESGRFSGVRLGITNAPGAWGNGVEDSMFGVFLYPLGADPVVAVGLENLPSGYYSFYAYGHGELDIHNSTFEVLSGGVSFGVQSTTTSSGWREPGWTRGSQYVLFERVVVRAGEPVVVRAGSAEAGLGIVNGLQVLQLEETGPMLLPIGDAETPEGAAWMLGLMGLHPTQALETLTYRLVESPEGMAVVDGGQILWTPTESQGPGDHTVRVEVRDAEGMTASQEFRVRVLEVNSPPDPAPVADKEVDEGAEFALELLATDSDLPPNSIAFELIAGPVGLSVSGDGQLAWIPSEAQGPSTNEVVVRVTDDGVPPLSATNRFQIVVREVNQAPVPVGISEEVVPAGSVVSFHLGAVDPDLPAQQLIHSLISGPEGLGVTADGVVTWSAGDSVVPGVYPVSVRVTDDGSPPLSGTNSFSLVVPEPSPMATLSGWSWLADPGRFEVIPGAFTWDEARSDAAVRGGHLATFGSLAEWEAGRRAWEDQGGRVWLGGLRSGDDTNPRLGWAWITGEPWRFEAWSPGEPNHLGEDRLDLFPWGAWNNASGDTRLGYLMEHPDRGGVRAFAPVTVDEGETFGVALRWSGPPEGGRRGTVELVLGPDGMVLTPTGALIWTPTEAQGPSTNEVVLRVTGDGAPATDVTFQVRVLEGNQAPWVASEWFLDFETDPAAFGTLAGSTEAAWALTGGNPGGFLGLTYSRTNRYTALVFPAIPDPDAVIAGFRMSCDLRSGNGTRERAADGFSFNFARVGDPVLESPENHSGYAGDWGAETGTRTGIAISFDTWSGNYFPGDPGDTNDIEGLIVRVDNVTVAKIPLPTRNGAATDPGSPQTGPHDPEYWAAGGYFLHPAAWATLSWQPLVLELSPDGRFSAWWKGAALVEDLDVGFEAGRGRFVLAGRTGGSDGNIHVDNLRLGVVVRHELDEEVAWTLPLDASDPDLPPQVLNHEVVAGPSGLGVNAAGALVWTPAEDQGPSTNTVIVRVRDTGSPPLTVTTTHQLVVREVNRPPVMASVPEQAVDENTEFGLTLLATDPDLPVQSLAFSLVDGPEGMTLAPGGALRWTPGEADGPSTVVAQVRVTDDGVPPLSATNRIVIVVREVNEAPVFTPVPDQAVDEGVPWSLALEATDPDWPVQRLQFLLVAGPAGLTVSSTGVMTWIPGEADGPGEFEVQVAVRDDGTPPRTTVQRFRVTVREVNEPPVIAPVPDQELDEHTELRLTLRATDPNLPPQAVTFSLAGGPAGMTVTPGGELRWTPGEADGPSTVIAEVRVTDDGVPPLSVTNRLVITVREVNEPPVLDPVADLVAMAGAPFEWLLTGSDPDLPAQPLTFALVSGPAGLAIGRDGWLRWTPPPTAAPSTNEATVALLDGTLSVRGAFRIVVVESIQLQIEPPRADGRMVLKIRAPLLKPIVVEQATVLGDWTEFQRLLGLGMESPIELLLSPGAGSEPSFWHVRGE